MKMAKRSLPALLAAVMMVMMLTPLRVYGVQYVLNTSTGKFHLPGCSSVARMSEANKSYVDLSYSEVVARGYEPCQICHPESGASAFVSRSTPAAAPVQTQAAAPSNEQVLQAAYAAYIQAGLSSDAAFARVQSKTAEFLGAPTQTAAIVQTDLAFLMASAAAAQAPAAQVPAVQVPAVQAPVAAPNSAEILQAAYAAYIQAGLSSDAAFARVQAKTAEFLGAPTQISTIVQLDLASLASAAAPALSPEQIVQQAFALYVQAGLDADTAFARVQAKLAELLAAPANMAAIVQADVLALQGGGAAALTPEQKVQQAFAALVGQGMSADQAMAAVQANLAAILAQ